MRRKVENLDHVPHSVPLEERCIVAIGGGGFDAADAPVLRYLLGMTRKSVPKICFLPTAYGDDKESIAWFYHGMAQLTCTPAHLQLFHRTTTDIRSFLLEQDLLYVGGGSTVNLLAIWRAHGVQTVLQEAWARGIVLCGVSAGANCWFEASVTDSFRPELDPLRDGIGLLPGSVCPHYDGETQRRPVYHQLVTEGFPAGVAIDDNVGVRYSGTQLTEVITTREGATAYSVKPGPTGLTEQAFPARVLASAE